jgi:DNA-binding CsgD family transcriptional regulator
MRGRDAEWRVVGELLRRARTGAGRVLLVTGEPGMGRSMLLREAGHEGSRQGFSLATGTADRLGGQLPLFALRMAVGFTTDDDDPSSSDLLPARISRLRERLKRRAQTDPLLVTLDDLQWASRETLLALRALPRELARYPIAWIFTRSAASGGKDAERLFAALKDEGAFQIVLRPLDTAVVTAMLADAFGAPPDDGLLKLAADAGGNPSLLSDLIDGWREEKTVRVTDGRACLSSTRIPRRIARAARQWLDVSEPARRLLHTVAVLGGEFRPGDVAEVVGTPPAALLPSIAEALDAGIIVADDDKFSFRYRLLARAAAAAVPQPVRRVLHRQYGEILLRTEGTATEAAGHLLRGAAPGDPASLAGLDSGASRVLPRSPGTAAELAVRALELTGPGSPAQTRRAVAAAEALVAAGRPGQGARIAYETLAQPIAVPLETRLRCALASALNMSGQAGDAVAQADKVLNSPDPHGLRDDALGAWLQAATVRHDERTGPVTAGVLASTDEHAGHVVAAAGTVRAMLTWDEGRTAEALALLREAARRSGGLSPHARHSQPLLVLAARLIDLRRLDEAASVIQAGEDKGGRRGLAGIALALLRARLHLGRGQLIDAGTEAGAALDAAESAGADAYASVARSLLALVALRQGRVNEAGGHITSRAVLPPHAAAVYAPAETCVAPAQVVAAAGGPAAAVSQILKLCADPPALRRVLLGDPALAVWPVRTALAGGKEPLAARIVAAIESLSAPDTPAVGAAAAHARGLLTKDEDALAYAAAHHADPWARASAAEDLAVIAGSATARDAAVGRLNEALEGYGKAGATADLARVRARLRGLGIRRRHWETSLDRPVDGWESLTDTERAVAELIAQGLTNQQAADRMYISTHTVAHHLRQAFRKLSIGSRVELTRIVVERSRQADG